MWADVDGGFGSLLAMASAQFAPFAACSALRQPLFYKLTWAVPLLLGRYICGSLSSIRIFTKVVETLPSGVSSLNQLATCAAFSPLNLGFSLAQNT